MLWCCSRETLSHLILSHHSQSDETLCTLLPLSLCETWLYPSWFCSHLFLIHRQYTCTSGLFGTEGATRLSSSAALLSPSHAVTGSGTSPGSSGTGCWPMSLETDCGPRRADTADMLHTQTACFAAGMISCERRCRSCGGRGRSPFHWHLTRE